MFTKSVLNILWTHKVDKKSHLILKADTFVTEMESLRRFIVGFLPLFFLFSVIHASSGPSSVASKSGDFNPFEENGKIGLKNQKGDILIPAQYDAIGWSNGTFSVVENVTGYEANGKWGLINLTNHKVTKPEFADLSPGNGSIIIARKKLQNSIRILTGCISAAGKVIIPLEYDGLSILNLRAVVYHKEGNFFKHGLIDFENNILIPLNYQSIYHLGSLRYAVVSFDNKTAIFSEEGKQLTNFLIDSIDSFKKKYAVIYQNQRQGLINRDGQIILEPTYREIKIHDDGTIHTRKSDSWFFLKGDNKLIRQSNADSIKALTENLYALTIAGITNLTDEKLTPINNRLLTNIGKFSHGKALFDIGNKKGVVRKNGKILIEPFYDQLFTDINFYIGGHWTNSKNLRWILMDSLGKSITSRGYEQINSYNGRFFPVKNNGHWGALNEQGREFVACVHDSLIQYLNQHLVVKFKGKYGIINTKEDWVITPQNNPLLLLENDRYLEMGASNKFLRNLKGEVIYFTENKIDIRSDYLLEFLPSGMIWKVTFNGIIADRFPQTEGLEYIFRESEGYRAIKKDGRFGFIDSRSRLRIANRYENVIPFSEGLAGAKILGKWGYISKEDKIAIQPVFDEVFSFINGFAVVRQKSLFGLIDKSGKVVLPVRYENIEALPRNRFRIKQNGLYGLADDGGKMIVNTKFDSLVDLNNDFIIVERDGKFGVVKSNGLSTIPMMYDGISFDVYHNQFLALKKSAWEEYKF